MVSGQGAGFTLRCLRASADEHSLSRRRLSAGVKTSSLDV